MSRRGWLLFLTMGLIWGVPYLFIKVAVEHLTPASLVFLRTSVAALLLVPVAAAQGQLRPLLKRWRPLLAYTAAELTIPWFFLAHAETRLSSSLTGLLLAAVPLVGALLGWFSKTDRLDWRRALGLFVGLLGVAALVGLDLGRGDILALCEVLIVAVGYAVGPFVLARSLSDLPGLGVVAASLLLNAVVYAVPGTIQLPRQWPPASTIIAVLVLAVVCTAVAFLLFFKLIDEVGPARATVITYLNPAVAVALGVVFLDEPFTIGIVVGFALVLLGSALATRRSRPPVAGQPAGEEAIGEPAPAAP
jgi:drug/metabolite transporter (DMT)-like permease